MSIPTTQRPSLEQAYSHCVTVTTEQARNFAWGIRLLSAPRRRALCAVYALARRIDDIGDGPLPDSQKLSGLAEVRKNVAQLGSADTNDPVYLALADAAGRFPIPLGAFDELVDGVEMDVRGTTYETFEDLVGYCRRVAGTVGRLCLGVYVARDRERASRLADTLGVALQQTNVLRDVREDLIGGRVYLPSEDLERFGVRLEIGPDGALGGPPAALAELVGFWARRADEWYSEGLQMLELLDRRSAAATAAMAGIYVRLNARLAADPSALTTRRVSLPGPEKALVALRALALGRP